MSGARGVHKIGSLGGNRVGEGYCAERVITEMGEGTQVHSVLLD